MVGWENTNRALLVGLRKNNIFGLIWTYFVLINRLQVSTVSSHVFEFYSTPLLRDARWWKASKAGLVIRLEHYLTPFLDWQISKIGYIGYFVIFFCHPLGQRHSARCSLSFPAPKNCFFFKQFLAKIGLPMLTRKKPKQHMLARKLAFGIEFLYGCKEHLGRKEPTLSHNMTASPDSTSGTHNRVCRSRYF